MGVWKIGETFSARVSVVTRSGTGAVKFKDGILTIGPVSCKKGKRVQVKRISSDYGICLTESARGENYEEYIQNVQSQINLSGEPEIDGEVEQGEIIQTEIAEVRGSIGVIEVLGHELLIGPVSAKAGTEIEAEYVGGEYARCLTESIHLDNYESRFNILRGSSDEVPLEIGEEYTATVKESYDDWAVSIVDGAAIALQSGEVVPGQQVDVEVTGWARQSATGELLNKHSPPIPIQEQTVQTGGDSEAEAVQTTTGSKTHHEVEDEASERDLTQLKQKAKQQSQTEVTITTTETTEYSRSTAIKRYVKARADGVCEGCDTPAPFENTDGEPYLHAHHIHELSEAVQTHRIR